MCKAGIFLYKKICMQDNLT